MSSLVDVPKLVTETLFYDGHCALCHHTVRFVLTHDPSGNAFRFAPLDGETFLARVPGERRSRLPDSLVVLTADNELLVRSTAILHILRSLGGRWRTIAAVLGLVPRAVRDAAYDIVAFLRYRIFGKRKQLCPVIDPALRRRFDS
jgi:predicted DCC family thiol-disulfide oxidoreductase YuxK